MSKNIVTTFPILAKTGRIDFPLRCITKKTVLKILPQDTDQREGTDTNTNALDAPAPVR